MTMRRHASACAPRMRCHRHYARDRTSIAGAHACSRADRPVRLLRMKPSPEDDTPIMTAVLACLIRRWVIAGDWAGECGGRWSATEAAAAVNDDALAGDEAGAFGGQEAHGVGDVGGGSHPPGRHRGEISTPGAFGHIGVAFHGDEAGCDRVHGDTGWGELTGPAEGQAYLSVLGGGIGRPARG